MTQKLGINGISFIASNSAAILNVLLNITPCLFLVDDARGLSRLSSSKSKYCRMADVVISSMG